MKVWTIFTIVITAFVLSLLTFYPATARVGKPLTIGISYNQVMETLDQHVNMSKSTDVKGEPRYMGQTSDNLAMIEVVGDQKDISQATLIIAIPNDSPKIVARNTVMFLRFMKNVAPDWSAGTDWATSAFKRVSTTGEEEEFVMGNKLFKLSIIKAYGMVMLSVKHKNAV